MFKQANPIRNLLSSVAVFALISSTALAEEGATKIAVRTGIHDDYTRIVFECPSPPSYQAGTSGTTLTIDFAKAVMLDSEGKSLASLPRIEGVRSGGDKKVLIDFTKGQSVRHFVIGNRLIVDLRGKASPVEEKKTEEKTSAPRK
jgi:hypothetical protein